MCFQEVNSWEIRENWQRNQRNVSFSGSGTFVGFWCINLELSRIIYWIVI